MALFKSFILALSAVTAVTAAPVLETRENAEAPMYSGTWDQFPGNETWLAFEDLVRTPPFLRHSNGFTSLGQSSAADSGRF